MLWLYCYHNIAYQQTWLRATVLGKMVHFSVKESWLLLHCFFWSGFGMRHLGCNLTDSEGSGISKTLSDQCMTSCHLQPKKKLAVKLWNYHIIYYRLLSYIIIMIHISCHSHLELISIYRTCSSSHPKIPLCSNWGEESWCRESQAGLWLLHVCVEDLLCLSAATVRCMLVKTRQRQDLNTEMTEDGRIMKRRSLPQDVKP